MDGWFVDEYGNLSRGIGEPSKVCPSVKSAKSVKENRGGDRVSAAQLKEMAERNLRIIEDLKDQGQTQREIGRRYGLTRNRVNQLNRAWHLYGPTHRFFADAMNSASAHVSVSSPNVGVRPRCQALGTEAMSLDH